MIRIGIFGATCVGIGSAVYHQGDGVFADISCGIQAYMDRHSYHSIEEFRGRALV